MTTTVMMKFPGTGDGVAAIEELTARGVNVNVTLLFSVEQWRAVAEAYVRGLERRRERLAVPRDAGARAQRLLWASTSPKDPRLPDTFYVTALAASDTVNTMPKQTLFAFADHGQVGALLPPDAFEAEETLRDAAAAGLDIDALGRELQDEGDEQFAASFERLLSCIRAKTVRLRAGRRELRDLGPLSHVVSTVHDELAVGGAVRRLWTRDHTLWQDDPTEVADRLGWLAAPAGMEEQALRRVEAQLPVDTTLVLASSKSGTTTETRTLLEWFWERAPDPPCFAVITDPGSPLADLGRNRGFRAGNTFDQPDVEAAKAVARSALRDRHQVAPSLGIGPRYLHSTGQLQKGGPERIIVVQVLGEDTDDPPIPGEAFGFATLKRAQAAGDLATLRRRGRRAGRVRLDDLLEVPG